MFAKCITGFHRVASEPVANLVDGLFDNSSFCCIRVHQIRRIGQFGFGKVRNADAQQSVSRPVQFFFQQRQAGAEYAVGKTGWIIQSFVARLGFEIGALEFPTGIAGPAQGFRGPNDRC